MKMQAGASTAPVLGFGSSLLKVRIPSAVAPLKCEMHLVDSYTSVGIDLVITPTPTLAAKNESNRDAHRYPRSEDRHCLDDVPSASVRSLGSSRAISLGWGALGIRPHASVIVIVPPEKGRHSTQNVPRPRQA